MQKVQQSVRSEINLLLELLQRSKPTRARSVSAKRVEMRVWRRLSRCMAIGYLPEMRESEAKLNGS